MLFLLLGLCVLNYERFVSLNSRFLKEILTKLPSAYQNKFFPGIWKFCRESGNLGNFSGNIRYFRGH